MHWKDIRFSGKMMIGIGTVLVLLIVVAVWSIYGINTIVGNGLEVAAGNRLRSELLQREVDHLKWAQEVGKYVYDDKVSELNVQLDDTQCNFGKWYYGEGRKQAEALLPALKEPLAAIEQDHKKLHESAASIKSHMAGGSRVDAQSVYEKDTLPRLAAVQTLLKKITGLSKEHILSEDVMLKQAMATRARIGVLSLIAVIAGILFGVAITRSLSRMLVQTVEFAKAITQGDLAKSLEIRQKDEIGQLAEALNGMVHTMKNVIADVQNAADSVASGSGQLSMNSEQMSQGTTEQAASAEEASASIEEMSATIRQNADNAHQTEKIAVKSAGDAQESGKAVLETVGAMKEIAQKISIIEEIARQTNLLALNAAIEAAPQASTGRGSRSSQRK